MSATLSSAKKKTDYAACSPTESDSKRGWPLILLISSPAGVCYVPPMTLFFRSICLFTTLICLTLLPIEAMADQEAEAILQAARVNPLGNPITLNAELRTELPRNMDKVPFRIAVRDGKISYLFQNPNQEILLGLGDKSSTLEERRGGKSGPVLAARYDDPVRGGLLCYEDLALRFLYWKNPKLLGEETVATVPAYKIEIQAPPTTSQYGVVRVWIARQSGALIRIEGYDRNGKLAKSFKINSAQTIDGQWMLKEMRIESFAPDSRKVTGRTYLEILGKAD